MSLSAENVLHGAPVPEDFANGSQSLAEFLKNRLKQHADFLTLTHGTSNEQLTSNALLQAALRVSVALQALGIRDSDTVAMCSENRLEIAIAMFGTLLHGATLVPMSPSYSTRELHHAFQVARPKVVFASADSQAAVHSVVSSCAFVQTIVVLDALPTRPANTIAWSDFFGSSSVDKYHCRPQQIGEKVALILFSSGTTGLPKGVELTEKNIMVSIVQHEKYVDRDIELHAPEPIVLTVGPWSHAFGCMGLIGLIACREAIVFLPKFVPDEFLAAIQRHRCNTTHVVPPLMVFLAKHPLVAQYDLSSLKVIGCGAAPLSRELELAVCKRIGVPVVRQGYGMTESTLALTQQTAENCKVGSVGVLQAGTAGRVVDIETGRLLPANQRGELQFAGATIMKGYIGDRKATEETVDADGWLHTGDIGLYDEDGEWFIVDRLKELIKYNGFQVPPAEIEGILLQHPAISDVGVVGVPDERVGEMPLAFVVRQAGAELTEREVMDFVAARTSKAKRLHGGVRFVAAIPKNPSGKILRRELRDLLKAPPSKL